MLKNKKYIATIISFAMAFAIIYYFYKSGKNQEYASFSLFLTTIFGYLIPVVAGTLAILLRPIKMKSISSIILYNLIAALNIMISIAGPILISIESKNQYNIYLIFFILPFIIGFLIFKNIYFNRVRTPIK